MTGVSRRMSEKDMSSITPTSSPVSSPQMEYFFLRWKACRGAGRHAVILYYDSSLNETTVLALHRSHQSFIGVQVRKHAYTPRIQTQRLYAWNDRVTGFA